MQTLLIKKLPFQPFLSRTLIQLVSAPEDIEDSDEVVEGIEAFVRVLEVIGMGFRT